MGQKHGEEFKCEAVRLALTSGLTRKQVAADLRIGLSTLGKWISKYRAADQRTDLPSADTLKALDRLRREVRILKDFQGSADDPEDCRPAARGRS